jgi:hypothetical protein
MGANSQPFDPAQTRLMAAQQAQQTTNTVLAAQLPKFKQELIKDIQLSAAKGDFQAATLSSQLFKMDHSLFKWDEKGFTFAGRPIGPNFSLNGALHRDANEKDKKSKDEQKQAVQNALDGVESVREQVKDYETEIKRHVQQAKTMAGQARDDARKAQQDAGRADNLLRSATNSAQRAAGQATRAGASLAGLEQRVKQLEGVLL